MNRLNWIVAVSAAAAICGVANANTYAGSDWTLNYNLNGQIELDSGSFISFSTGNQTVLGVSATDLFGPDPGANFLPILPDVGAMDLYEIDYNGNAVLGDVGDRLKRVYGDDLGETALVIDGATMAWMNPILSNYMIEISLMQISATINLKNGARVYDLRDGKGFWLEGNVYAKPGSDMEDGTIAASSKFNLTRAVPEPGSIAAIATGLVSLIGFRNRRRS
jgi:hypothetical protein